jgi:hypothetical protein
MDEYNGILLHTYGSPGFKSSSIPCILVLLSVSRNILGYSIVKQVKRGLIILMLGNIIVRSEAFRPPLWSEFLATDPEVPGSISGATKFSEK